MSSFWRSFSDAPRVLSLARSKTRRALSGSSSTSATWTTICFGWMAMSRTPGREAMVFGARRRPTNCDGPNGVPRDLPSRRVARNHSRRPCPVRGYSRDPGESAHRVVWRGRAIARLAGASHPGGAPGVAHCNGRPGHHIGFEREFSDRRGDRLQAALLNDNSVWLHGVFGLLLGRVRGGGGGPCKVRRGGRIRAAT